MVGAFHWDVTQLINPGLLESMVVLSYRVSDYVAKQWLHVWTNIHTIWSKRTTKTAISCLLRQHSLAYCWGCKSENGLWVHKHANYIWRNQSIIFKNCRILWLIVNLLLYEPSKRSCNWQPNLSSGKIAKKQLYHIVFHINSDLRLSIVAISHLWNTLTKRLIICKDCDLLRSKD